MPKLILLAKYVTLALLIIFLSGCSGEENQQEAEKIKDKEKQVVEEGKKEIKKLISEMDQIEDSLNKDYKQILADKEALEKRRIEIEEKEKEFIEQKRQKKIQELQFEKQMLENNLRVTEDSLTSISTKFAELDKKREALTKEEEFVKGTETKAGEELVTGIVEIDAAVKSLKEEKSDEQKKLELIHKKTELANGKIAVLEKELTMYEEERDNLFTVENAQEEITQLDEKIGQLNDDIAVENNNLVELDFAKVRAGKRIQDLENQINDYSKEYKTEYDKKKGFDRYVQKESERLKSELALIEERKKQLSEDWKKWASGKERLQNKISGYKTEIEILKGKDISEVITELAEIEKGEIQLLEEEAKQLQKEQSQIKADTSAASTDERKLEKLRKKISEEKSKIAEDEEKLTKEKQDLMEKKQEATRERAERLSPWTLTAFIIIGLVIVSLVVFFFIGQKVRTGKKSA